ncbi:MAG: ABC transporter permease [Patescibacteria group bacterium]
MKLSENIHNSWHIIAANKVRSVLTMLGIIIGIMAVIVIMSVGAGAQSLIVNQVSSLGSNLVGVLPGKAEANGPPVSVMGIVITTLKYEDVKALVAGGDPHILAATGYVKGTDTVTWQDNKTDTTFVGVMASYPQVETAEVASGRFFSEEEERSTAKVAVLASQTAKNLFGDENPIGQQIKIKRVSFQVIGVLKARGTSGFQDQDDQIFVPITAAQKLLLGINYISYLRAQVDDASNVDGAVLFIEDTLRVEHNISNPANDDFTVRSSAQGLDAINTVTNALKFFLAAIAALSLVVGGVGIMNIMLAAVQERTREIGLRKAVGARSSQISLQFLVETMMVTFIGGVIGILLGILVSFGIAKVAQSMGYKWDLVVTYSSIILACGVSAGIGLIFGIIPARRASALNPIEALRYE